MRIAVLGATGLVGRHLVEALRTAGHRDVIATYRARPPYECDGVEWRQADLMEPKEAKAALKGAQAVLHCAGRLSTTAELRRDPIGSVTDTLRIGVNVLEASAAERAEFSAWLEKAKHPIELALSDEFQARFIDNLSLRPTAKAGSS